MVNATNETNVSQKGCKQDYGKCQPEELRLRQIVSAMKHGATPASDDCKFLCKELNLNLRTAYGIYLAMCKEKGISKVITWRTFYMQCNGYRVLKPNTIEALVKYVNMFYDEQASVLKAVIANDVVTL